MAILDLNVTLDLDPFRLRVTERIELSGITAIVGASGSGKTTLLRIIAGLEHRAGGRVALDSAVWQDAGSRLPTHRRGVGYVFQDGALFEHLSVRSNLNFPLRFKRQSGSGIAIDDVVAALALANLLNRRPPTLSGGERQRVAIARALLSNPALLLMDEPVSSIDAARRRQIIDLIADLPDRFGIPVIYVTHDFTELMRLASRAILLADGKVAATGDVRTVARHADFSTDAFIRDAGSILEATVESHSARMTILRLHDQTLKIPLLDRQVGSAVRIRIPARDVVIALERPNLISIRNALATTIATVTERKNGMCDVQLRLGDQSLIARVTHEASDELALRGELQVFALIKSVAIDDGVGI